jgi:hypothetical protein
MNNGVRQGKGSKAANGPLKNVGKLAAALGVTPVFIKRMKWAGFQMPGGVATVQWALAWLKANPEFRQRDWTKPRRDGARQLLSAADK